LAAVEPMSGILVLECDESIWEFVTQTSYFVAISHMNSMSVWIIDPLRYYIFREKPQIMFRSKNQMDQDKIINLYVPIPLSSVHLCVAAGSGIVSDVVTTGSRNKVVRIVILNQIRTSMVGSQIIGS
jgi:hypothetical protein